jgi:hypothetical protein
MQLVVFYKDISINYVFIFMLSICTCLIFMIFSCICCMYRLTIISTLICVLAECKYLLSFICIKFHNILCVS